MRLGLFVPSERALRVLAAEEGNAWRVWPDFAAPMPLYRGSVVFSLTRGG